MSEPPLQASSIVTDQTSKTVDVQNQSHVDSIFDARGLALLEFSPQGQTVNQQVYKVILRRLCSLSKRKRFVGKQLTAASQL